MAYVIGLDEAGYGPNLGPLVIAATVWKVPTETPAAADFWADFAPLITSDKPRLPGQIQVADSKVVHDPQKGVGNLEAGVLAAWGLLEDLPDSWRNWWPAITGTNWPEALTEPWFAEGNLPLPCVHSAAQLQGHTATWNTLCEASGYRLVAQRAEVVFTRRFNELTTQYHSKGLALSRLSLQLVRTLLPLTHGEPTLVLADKHGGRNRYDDLLAEILDGAFLFRVEEGSSRSTYRWDQNEISFQTKSERFLPVALASMTAKYLRETAMDQFNAYWCGQLPGLLPTKGYPLDAKRFRQQITTLQQQLHIEDCDLWRAK